MKIKVEHVSKKFREREVLHDVNVAFDSGIIYGIIGENGSGKTMLLRILCGLMFPTTGRILVDDKVLHKDMDFPENAGILLEKPEFLGGISGFENLKILASIKNLISDEQIKEFMRMFSLNPEDKLPIRKYSLGMKQKLGIIQAIMEDQDLIILDEPFNALDEDSVELLRKLLLKYKEQGKLILITSHHKEDIRSVCDCVYKISGGVIKEQPGENVQ